MATIDDLLGSPDFLRQLIGEEQFARSKEQALNQGILQASLAALGGKGTAGQVLSQAGTAGLQGYQGSFDKTLSDLAKGMQVQELKRKQQVQQAQQKALQVATTGIQPAVIPEGQTLRDDQGQLTYGVQDAKEVPTAFNADVYKTYALKMGVDPKDISSTIEAMRGKTTTVKPGEVVLGEDMKPIYTAPREANYQVVDTTQGLMFFNPVTKQMTPAVDAQGQPLMGEKGKAPAKFTEQVGNINNLKQSVASYIQDIKDTDPRYLFPGSARAAELQTKYSNLMMLLKDAYGLGALQKPDLEVMDRIITDPVSMAGRYKGRESLEAQLNTINKAFSNSEKNLYKTYKQPVPKELEAIKDLPSPQDALGLKSIPKGVIINGVKY